MDESPNTRPSLLIPAFAAFCVVLVTAVPRNAWAAPELTVLYSFRSTSAGDGAHPVAGLIADSAGNLYGTTQLGGSSAVFYLGCGTVFKLTPSGIETVLYSFSSSSRLDGCGPLAGLIADSAGNLYGTTYAGGDISLGTVFKVTPSGTETVLHSFAGGGAIPKAGLIADSAGNLYGTASIGGLMFGTVFKLTPSGAYTVLHSFTGADGSDPEAGLIADRNGNLYGTTKRGGASNLGTVFKLTPSGTETVLHSFTGANGAYPVAGLIADSAGNLYGTTQQGGASNSGTVFKLTPSGAYTVLHSFTGSYTVRADGGFPYAGLIADGAGNLYGTTYGGGARGLGTVFKVTPSGTETVLYSLGEADGSNPQAGLIADRDGNLYGTTSGGGPLNPYSDYGGTVFKLTATGFVTPLAALLAEVTGVGPGTSLADKVKLAQVYYSANDIPTTCSMLTSFVNEVTAQNGKKISQSLAKKLISDAQAIEAAIGCGAQ